MIIYVVYFYWLSTLQWNTQLNRYTFDDRCFGTQRQMAGSLICLMLTLSLPLYDAKGANSDPTRAIYNPDPRDPVTSDSAYALQGTVGLDLSEDVYAEWSLAYYSRFYNQYSTFLITTDHWNTKERLKNRTLEVCVNHYITNVNTSLGRFTCPMPFEPPEFSKCCGIKQAEFCCYGITSRMDVGIGVFVVLVLGILGGGVTCYCCLGRRANKQPSDASKDEFYDT